MKTIIYGSKTFILETPDGIDMMTRSIEAREAGRFDEAEDLMSAAVRFETGLPVDDRTINGIAMRFGAQAVA